MKNLLHPSFLLGIFSMLLLFVGIITEANGFRAGDYILITSVALGGIHWIWSIINVIRRDDLKPFQKRFWLIAVVAAPAIGGLIFYIMHQERNKLTT